MNLRRDFNEGLGTVYERFILNSILDKILVKYHLKNILEYPVYGMTGVDGINSIHLAKNNVNVTLVDVDKTRLAKIKKYWEILNLDKKLKTFLINPDRIDKLPYKSDSFDLVWNFAALWFYKDADKIIKKMIDLSNKLVFISVNNKWQLGYPLRKFILDRNFFSKNYIDIKWINIRLIKRILTSHGLKIIEDGVFDSPPWPDTCLPINEIKNKIGIKRKPNQENQWLWSMMSYYAGEDPTLEKKIAKFMFIEKLPVWWRLKQIWSHHRYIIAEIIK